MPNIPIIEQRTSASEAGLGPGPSGVAGSGLNALGQALQGTGLFLQRKAEEDAAVSANDEIQQARSYWLTEFARRRDAAEPGAPAFAPTLQKDYETDMQQRLAKAKTRSAKAYMQQQLNGLGMNLQQTAIDFEGKAKAEDRKVKIGNALDSAATSVEIQPESLTNVLAEQQRAIDAMQDVPPIERQAWHEHAIDTLTERAAVGIARRDPDAALSRFTTSAADDTLFRSLSPRGRDAVLREIENQQRIRTTAEDRAYRDQQRQVKEVNDATAKDGDQLLYSGRLNAQWIASNREKLDESDVRYFYRALREEIGSGQSDPMLYAGLRDRAGRGQDVRDEARDALRNGRISTGDYDRLVGEVEQERPGWFRRGHDFIATSAAVSDLNPDPAAAQRKAAMLDDWAAWSDQNPKATDPQARDEYQRIVHEYAIVDYNKMSITKRQPTMLVGGRNAPDLDATEVATVKALHEGRMTREEFNKQAALIAEWRRLYTQTQQTAKPGAK